MISPSHLLLDKEEELIPLPGDIGHWAADDCYCAPQSQTIEVNWDLGRPVGTLTVWVHVA